MIPFIATPTVEGERHHAKGSTEAFACAHCSTRFRDLRCRIFRADGRLLCSTCYLDVRNQQREHYAKLTTTNARAACATAMTFAAGAVATIGALIAPSAITVVTGLVGLAVAHVLAELLAPRARRRFTT